MSVLRKVFMFGCQYMETETSRTEDWLDALQARAETSLEHCEAVVDECRRLIRRMDRDREELGKQENFFEVCSWEPGSAARE
jgi:predicted ATPase